MAAMDPMIELHPPADALDGLGLPAIPYPVALPVFQSAVANDGGPLPLADMLRGLQLRATDARVDWHRVEPAMSRLAELLAGDDSRERVALSGDGWRLEVTGDANARHAVVLQRGACRIAALGALRDGRLQLAAWRPLDAGALRLVLQLAGRCQDASDGAGARARLLAAMDELDAAARQADGQDDACAHQLVPWTPVEVAAPDDDPAASAPEPPALRRAACVAAELGAFTVTRSALD